MYKAISRQGEIVDIPDFKTPFNHDTEAESDRVALECKDKSLAIQSQKDEADINVIVERFGITGQLPQVTMPPSFQDFEDTFDFMTAMNTVAAAKHSFGQLTAEVRTAFGNDPHRFVSQVDLMLADTDADRRSKNMEVLRAMGLAVEQGPIADKTTLGDVLKAIKEQTDRGVTPALEPSKTA